MKKNAAKDDWLVRLTEICLALPQAERELLGAHASFKVRPHWCYRC